MPSMTLPPADGASPALAQWFAVKAEHPDALVFFRMGDFYELFFADAEKAAAALEIALTSRGEHQGAKVPMCGVPAAAAEAYLARLIRRGFRVAIAEQMEPPGKAGRGPIRREVVRLVTPGTLTEDELLEAPQPNLLLALIEDEAGLGAAWLDISTGRFETASLPLGELTALLGRLDPAEVLAPAGLALGEWEERRSEAPTAPNEAAARALLAGAFGILPDDAAFPCLEMRAGAAALAYVRRTQAGRMPLLSPPTPAADSGRLRMDWVTRASLELLRGRDGSETNSLLAGVRRTLTAAGSRLLAEWLAAPLVAGEAIAARQEAWVWLSQAVKPREDLRGALRFAPDLARALARLSLGRQLPRDLAAVRDGLFAAARASAALAGVPCPLLAQACEALDPAPGLADLLARALAEPLPTRIEEGSVIARGFDAEFDAERRLAEESRQVIAGLAREYAERFGVANLKIRHHAQLGYVIEVPGSAAERLRTNPALTLRQSMAVGARFSSTELADLDRRIAEAAERAAARERRVIDSLVRQILELANLIAAAAAALAQLDVLQGAAVLANAAGWCRPELCDDTSFYVIGGRHPAVAAALPPGRRFVANDCDLSPGRRLMLLTGPNMAGKSTYLRQNALIVVLAQAGLPVPAQAARIGLVDRLFSRVGATDDLARGRSTFMVEMLETAAILREAGPKSLAVIDEIGRGTATLDGLAIAWAVLEALHHRSRCRTIFATHFHELARLKLELPELAPHTMRVKEWKSEVVFLHEVASGAAGRSFGVHVARLAGVAEAVVRRAQAILEQLEARGPLSAAAELPLFTAPSPPPEDPLRAALAELNPDQMSPRAALETLYRLRQLAAFSPASDAIP